MTSFTPGPWRVGNKYKADIYSGTAFASIRVAACVSDGEANAAHIVRCVNSHAELLEALQELLKFPSGQYSTGNGFDAACLKAEAAIAKATS